MRISILKALGTLLTSLLGMMGGVPEQSDAVVEAPKPAAAVEAAAVPEAPQVPRAVVDAVKFAYPAGVLDLDNATMDVDDDETTYEVPLMNHGNRFKVEVDSGGAIREIEGELAPLDLPKAVTRAVAGRFHLGATTTAEEHVEIEGGRETKVFKLVVVYDGRPLDVEVRPDGVIEDVDVDD